MIKCKRCYWSIPEATVKESTHQQLDEMMLGHYLKDHLSKQNIIYNNFERIEPGQATAQSVY